MLHLRKPVQLDTKWVSQVVNTVLVGVIGGKCSSVNSGYPLYYTKLAYDEYPKSNISFVLNVTVQ